MKAIVVRGQLGWGNRKAGLEAYGPGGRWSKLDDGTDVPTPNGGNPLHGDLLGDALERAGAAEGCELLVIAVPRFGVQGRLFDAIQAVVELMEFEKR